MIFSYLFIQPRFIVITNHLTSSHFLSPSMVLNVSIMTLTHQTLFAEILRSAALVWTVWYACPDVKKVLPGCTTVSTHKNHHQHNTHLIWVYIRMIIMVPVWTVDDKSYNLEIKDILTNAIRLPNVFDVLVVVDRMAPCNGFFKIMMENP